MQDFTKINERSIDLARSNSFEKVADKYQPEPPKPNFFQARWNKDNFWNLMFTLGMLFGSAAVVYITDGKPEQANPIPPFIIAWSTLLGVPFIIRKFNKTTFTEDKKFLNSRGQDITDRVPSNLSWFIVLVIAVPAFTGFMLDGHNKTIGQELGIRIVLFVMLLTPALYFIILNCPISVLFSLDFWKIKSTDSDVAFTPPRKNPFSSSSSSTYKNNDFDRRYSPAYSYLANNIHHKK